MKQLLITAITAFIYTTTVAQLTSNLIVQAQPPAQLSEWGNRREVLTLIVSAPGAIGAQFKLKTEIKTLDGMVIGSADLAKTPVFTPNSSGTTILVANDVMPLEYMVFTGKYKTSLQRTGKLPADNYTICVQPVQPTDYRPMGEVQCKNFYLATTQLPILMKPYNEEVLDGKKAQTAIIFRWTPVVPRQTSPVTYRIQVFEVLPTQSPVQALRSNQPLLDKEILAATQFIWQPQLGMIDWYDESKEEAMKVVARAKIQSNNKIDPSSTLKSNAPVLYVLDGKIISYAGDLNPDDIEDVTVLQPAAAKEKYGEAGAFGAVVIVSKKAYKEVTEKATANKGKMFIWTIQSLDKDRNPVTRTDGNGEGRSEPLIFFVNPDKNKKPGKGN